jgi:hypothetical protein
MSDRDEATNMRRVGQGTPGSPDIWMSETAIAQLGEDKARESVRRIYEKHSTKRRGPKAPSVR